MDSGILYGYNLFGDPIEPPARGKMAGEFLMPPFSVLDARQGAWQERKRRWIALGIRSELGRGANGLGLSAEAAEPGLNHYRDAATFGCGGPGTLDEQRRSWRSSSGNDGKAFRIPCESETPNGDGKSGHTASLKGGLTLSTTTDPIRVGGKSKATPDRLAQGCPAHVIDVGGEGGVASQSGTSIFDPVLCELAYRWFCPPGGLVLDPFAGGSVRGIVAGVGGYRYHGIELRPEQVAANREQAAAIAPGAPIAWHCGDARELLADAPTADFVFTCPPYGDLERYSDDPRDLSAMDWPAFLAAYRDVIAAAVARLAPDRFAVVVVGDFRGPGGEYRGFPAETVRAFRDAGAAYHNEGVLITMVGSLPIRAGKQFRVSRKFGKTHQNVLMFVKGDPARAAAGLKEPTDV